MTRMRPLPCATSRRRTSASAATGQVTFTVIIRADALGVVLVFSAGGRGVPTAIDDEVDAIADLLEGVADHPRRRRGVLGVEEHGVGLGRAVLFGLGDGFVKEFWSRPARITVWVRARQSFLVMARAMSEVPPKTTTFWGWPTSFSTPPFYYTCVVKRTRECIRVGLMPNRDLFVGPLC